MRVVVFQTLYEKRRFIRKKNKVNIPWAVGGEDDVEANRSDNLFENSNRCFRYKMILNGSSLISAYQTRPSNGGGGEAISLFSSVFHTQVILTYTLVIQ